MFRPAMQQRGAGTRPERPRGAYSRQSDSFTIRVVLRAVHDPSRGPWTGFGALAGMAHKHNGHRGAFPCPLCAGFEWSPDQDLGALVYEGSRLVEESALIRRLMTP